jgi:hypothetical protein
MDDADGGLIAATKAWQHVRVSKMARDATNSSRRDVGGAAMVVVVFFVFLLEERVVLRVFWGG